MTDVYNRIIDNTIVALCTIKSYINSSIVKSELLFKIDYLKRLLHCYHIIMDSDRDTELDVKLYLALNGRDRVSIPDSDGDMDNFLDDTTRRYTYLSTDLEYRVFA